MKKWFLLIGFLLLVGFVIGAQDTPPSVGVFGAEDGNSAENNAVKLQETIDDYVPIDESGKVDYGKYKPFVSKAEGRIAAINLWLDENVGWMRYIFHMKPAVSLLFFINVYFILLFFVILFLNGNGLWFFIEDEKRAKIFGFAVFAIFLVVRLYYGLALTLYNWWLYFWNTFVDASIWLGIFGFVIFILLLIFFPSGLFAIARLIAQYNEGKRVARDKMKLATSVEAVDAFMGQIGKR